MPISPGTDESPEPGPNEINKKKITMAFILCHVFRRRSLGQFYCTLIEAAGGVIPRLPPSLNGFITHMH